MATKAVYGYNADNVLVGSQPVSRGRTRQRATRRKAKIFLRKQGGVKFRTERYSPLLAYLGMVT